MDLFFHDILDWFATFPAGLATAVLASIPFLELRASIPIAIKVFHLNPFSAFVWSVVGNSVPAAIILLLIDPVNRWAQAHWKWLANILARIYERAQKKLKGREKLEGLALAVFVGLPLPGTGAWTGALLAFLLGMPFKKSFPYIFLGIVIAGLIMLLVTSGVFASINFIARR